MTFCVSEFPRKVKGTLSFHTLPLRIQTLQSHQQIKLRTWRLTTRRIIRNVLYALTLSRMVHCLILDVFMFSTLAASRQVWKRPLTARSASSRIRQHPAYCSVTSALKTDFCILKLKMAFCCSAENVAISTLRNAKPGTDSHPEAVSIMSLIPRPFDQLQCSWLQIMQQECILY